MIRILALLAGLLLPIAAIAQDAPRPIRWIVPYPPGGNTDAMARLTAQRLAALLPATIIVENRGGAAGSIGSDVVRHATPDGQTLLFNASIFVLARLVLRAAPYDPQQDFQPVARVAEAPLLVLVAPNTAVTTLADLAAAARRNPAAFAFALSSPGSAGHLASLEFNRLAGVDITLVPYRGAAPALADLMGGSVQLFVDAGTGALQQVQAGRLRALAITTATRSPLAPEVPTSAESGMPGLVMASWYGVWAPRGLPATQLARLAEGLRRVTEDAEFRDRAAAIGTQPAYDAPPEFARFIAADLARNTALLEAAGFQPD